MSEATIIVAVSSNGVIGRDNGLPWRIPEDLRRFKQLTMGRTLLMGRRTFDSIGRPLPGRETVVLTRQRDWQHDGVSVIHTIEEARQLMADREVVIAGGGELYREFWPDADKLEVTHVDQDIDGDTFLPTIAAEDWSATDREDHDGYSFVSYRRR